MIFLNFNTPTEQSYTSSNMSAGTNHFPAAHQFLEYAILQWLPQHAMVHKISDYAINLPM